MFLKLFLISAALTLGCIAAAVKIRRFRLCMAVLGVIAAVPTVLWGLLLCGAGSLVSYPGDPQATVTEFFSAVQDGDLAAADRLLLGGTCIDTEGLSEETLLLMEALSEGCMVQTLGEPLLDGCTAVQTVTITRTDADGILLRLDEAAYTALDELVQGRDAELTFNADSTAYLPHVTEEAFQIAFRRLTDSAHSSTAVTGMDISLVWTPLGWRLQPDAELCRGVTGYDSLAALDGAVTHLHSKIPAELPLIPKIYILEDNCTAGPKPDPDGFHTTTDPQEVAAVIAQAAYLLDGQTMAWNPDIALAPDSEIRYYYDSSILVIIWQEIHDNCVVTYSEVKLAHPSQLLRVMCSDAYQTTPNTTRWEKTSTMAKRANAVFAVSGDFYRHRDGGVTVYQRKLYRNYPGSLDTCFINSSGDLLLVKRWELKKKETPQYIEDNDVRFSLAFGPVLIRDGKKLKYYHYPVGEITDPYDRCALGQLDELHYLVLTANFTRKYKSPPVLSQAADYLYEKGCVQGYALDGGRTGSMVFNGEVVNHINYGGERAITDALCFVSALPEKNP